MPAPKKLTAVTRDELLAVSKLWEAGSDLSLVEVFSLLKTSGLVTFACDGGARRRRTSMELPAACILEYARSMADDEDSAQYFRRWARREYLTKHEQKAGRGRRLKGRGGST
jgi:hypothetical protein